MKSKKWLWLFLPIALCLGLLGVCVWNLAPIVSGNRNPSYTWADATSMFDELNNATLAQFPPPNGVVETDHSINGEVAGSQELGRTLVVDYKITNYTSTSVTEIETYYINLLSSKGWRPTEIQDVSGGILNYYKGSGCISVLANPSPPAVSGYDTYAINIWYDYYSQSFSPPKPNLQLLELLNFGQLVIDTCP